MNSQGFRRLGVTVGMVVGIAVLAFWGQPRSSSAQPQAEGNPPADKKPAGEQQPPEKKQAVPQDSEDQTTPGGHDWPFWRGPEQNGISRERGIVDRWSADGENLLWKNEELAGRSTPIVMNGKLYTIVRDQPETRLEAEKVVCVDAATGEKIWENRFNVFLSDVPDTRVGWSSVVGDPDSGDVYALGVCGYFQRINGKTGKTIWARSMSEEYGMLTTYGGRTNFPIIHGQNVIISGVIIGWGEMAKPTHRFICFDKRNGQPVWFEGTRLLPEDTTYSTPIISVIGGEPQMVFGSGDGGIHSFQPLTGKKLWSYDASFRGVNATPLVVGDVVITGQSEENIDDNTMGSLFAIDATKRGDLTKEGELWRNKSQFVGRAAPLHLDGRIYAADDRGTMLVLDLKTGKTIFSRKLGGTMRASPLYVDGKIFVCTQNGIWWTFKPTEEGLDTVFQARMRIGEVDGSPIVSHGRLYVPTSSGLYCIGQEDHQPTAEPIPPAVEAPLVTENLEVAHVQLVPVESLLRPGNDFQEQQSQGQKQQMDVRLYNKLGQFLRMARPGEITFTLDGPGTIDENGKYETPSESVHASVYVTATVGELSSTARIRVVPDLPWEFTFDGGEIPATFVGVRYRHVGIDFDLLKQLEAEDPRAAQLYIFFISEFTNNETEALSYDDSTYRLRWTELRRFVNLLNVQTLEDAKQEFEPSLEILKREKFLASWDWSDEPPIGLQFKVNRGPRKIDGNGVMMKITTIPKGTRSQGWMGHTDFNNYTIQADVYGATKNGQIPDIGLTAQRYTLDMMGAHQQLQIRTWHAQLRMAQQIPFEWTGDTWYTMKLQAAVEDGKAVLKGKVWPRDQPEPSEWMLEAVDESPNLQGSPGLYGKATDAEIFYDNLKVFPNVTSGDPSTTGE